MTDWIQSARRSCTLLLALAILALQILGAQGLSLCVCTGSFVPSTAACHGAELDSFRANADLEPDPALSHAHDAHTDNGLCSDEENGHCEDHLSLDTHPMVLLRPGGEWTPPVLVFLPIESFLGSLLKTLSLVKVMKDGPSAAFATVAQAPPPGVTVARTLVLRI